MAALVLGLAGAAIGGSTAVTGVLGISATMGASIGWSIGSMLGGMIGPKTRIEGPRLQDGKVQAATHGQVIPILYGSFRTAGNVIDFSGMREHAKEERSKKAKSVVTTYSYECDVAVGICEGEIGGVRRIWANNELIYSVAEDADLATIQASNQAAGNIKIYTGSETQLPDPTLEALHGAGNVPAYRGLAYIVISRIWVEKYGNRLPNFEFEVVGVSPSFSVRDTGISLTTHSGSVQRRVSPRLGSSILETTTTPTQPPKEFSTQTYYGMRVDTRTVHPYTQVISETYTLDLPNGFGLFPANETYFGTSGPPGAEIHHWLSSRVTHRQVSRFHGRDGVVVLGVSDMRAECLSVTPLTEANPIYYAARELADGFWGQQCSALVVVFRRADVANGVVRTILPINNITPSVQGVRMKELMGVYADNKYILYRASSQSDAPPDMPFTLFAARVIEYEETSDIGLGAPRIVAYGIDYGGNVSDLDVWSSATRHGDALYLHKAYGVITKLDLMTGAQTLLPLPSPLNTVDLMTGNRLVPSFSADGSAWYLYRINPATSPGTSIRYKRYKMAENFATIIEETEWTDYQPFSTGMTAYMTHAETLLIQPKYSSSIEGSVYVASPTQPRTDAPLRSIIHDLSARVGVVPDVSNIPADLRVGGYVISRQIPARGAIEPLQNAYFFDAVESDNGLKFVMRGAEPVATIVDDDMMAGIDQAASGDPCAIVRGQEVELPQQVSVSYADWDSDYQTSAELVQRQATPSVNRVATELPIAMSATQAARIADVWMYQAWSERTQLAFKVGPKHMLLEPTDVVTVQTAGRSYKARITSKTDDRGVIDIAAVVDGGRYTSSATGSSNFGSQNQIGISSPTVAFFIDAPIVLDAENDAGLYVAMIPEAVLTEQVSWGGATLMSNEGGTSDVTRTVGGVGAPAGCVAQVLLPVPALPSARANIVDQSYSIKVKTNGVGIDSISREALFNGGNLFALVSSQTGVAQELIQFQIATETAEFEYALTGILRGRFGTEAGMNAVIAAGSYLVQINPRRSVLRVPATPAQIGQAFAYKAVTNGGAVEDAQTVSYAGTGRGLLPYAPVRLNAAISGSDDWQLRWTRRSRLDGGWREGVDVPLGEAIERYSVAILGGRTVVVAQQSFIYTASMQVEDFGSLQSEISFTVAQISEAVGNGQIASFIG